VVTSDLTLVTGGAGYFGCVIAEKLLRRGERVRVFDIAKMDTPPAGFEVVQGDIRDRAAVERACEGVAVIHHNVAQVPLAKDRQAFFSVNRDGTENLLRAALSRGVRKVIHTSSSAVFGAPTHNPVTESTPPRPQEAYGAAKLEAEKLAQQYAKRGLDVTIVRPRTIMGHGRLGIMQILFEWIRQGRPIPVLDGGRNTYQFVHADDLAEACILASERRGADIYNIGADRFGTMRETLEGVIEHAKSRSRIVSVPMGPTVLAMNAASRLGLSPLGAYHSLMYGRSMYFDVDKAKRELGWSPRVGNVEMFCESYDWYIAHREEVLGRAGASHHRSPVKQGILGAVSWALQWVRDGNDPPRAAAGGPPKGS
jgi:nucleoside-diphosphate-sugar epimerase